MVLIIIVPFLVLRRLLFPCNFARIVCRGSSGQSNEIESGFLESLPAQRASKQIAYTRPAFKLLLLSHHAESFDYIIILSANVTHRQPAGLDGQSCRPALVARRLCGDQITHNDRFLRLLFLVTDDHRLSYLGRVVADLSRPRSSAEKCVCKACSVGGVDFNIPF